MDFIGRQQEIEKLKDLWGLRQPSLVAITGRRRIGKSRLVQEFGKTAKTFIEIQGLAPDPRLSVQDQVRNFLKILAIQTGTPEITADDWYKAFWHLNQVIKKDRTVVFLDEISWMGAADPEFAGTLKIAWDTLFSKHKHLIVILCGSVSSWIEQNILRSTDFVGRIQLSLQIEELPAFLLPRFIGPDARRMAAAEMMKLFAVTGGIPRYLEAIHPKKTVDDNIDALCFKRGALLVNEFEQIFSDIFSARAKTYRKIVLLLVHGKKSFSEICHGLGLPRSGTIAGYLEDLCLSGFLAKDFNYREGKATKLAYYRLKDNYLRFYLRYIEPEKDKINKGLYERKKIENMKNWSALMGLQFENLVLNNIELILAELKIDPYSVVSASPYFRKRAMKLLC